MNLQELLALAIVAAALAWIIVRWRRLRCILTISVVLVAPELGVCPPSARTMSAAL